jgi:molybdenum cofactor cytidylyltransferase
VRADKPLSAILLAAGLSRRFGGGKLRALWKGRPMVLSALEAALSAPVTEVILVWGGDPLILPLLPTDPRLKIIFCQDHLSGMGASLAAGIGALDPRSTGTYVFLGDMPRVPRSLSHEMAQILATNGSIQAAAPQFEGQRGHPVLLSSGLFPRLRALTGDQGAGAVLKDLGEALVLLQAPDDGCLFDIDRPDDLDSASARP